jgi:hypothetical protein
MERVAAGVNEGGREAAGLLMSLAALNNLLKLGPDSASKSANFLQPGRRLMAEVMALIFPELFWHTSLNAMPSRYLQPSVSAGMAKLTWIQSNTRFQHPITLSEFLQSDRCLLCRI